MNDFDPNREWRRLSETYSAMTEDELQAVADDAYELTDIARQVLQAEISRRGLPIELQKEAQTPENPDPPPKTLPSIPPIWTLSSCYASGTWTKPRRSKSVSMRPAFLRISGPILSTIFACCTRRSSGEWGSKSVISMSSEPWLPWPTTLDVPSPTPRPMRRAMESTRRTVPSVTRPRLSSRASTRTRKRSLPSIPSSTGVAMRAAISGRTTGWSRKPDGPCRYATPGSCLAFRDDRRLRSRHTHQPIRSATATTAIR